MLDSRTLASVALLALQWCLGIAAFFIQVSTTSAATTGVTGDDNNATIPVGLVTGTAAMLAAFVPTWTASYGTRNVYMVAAFTGLVGAALDLIAVIQSAGQFTLLIIGAVLQGFAFACTLNIRFAVIQLAPPDLAPRLVSYVIAGGIFAAGIGPEASKSLRTALDEEHAGTYILLMGIYAAMFCVPMLVDFERRQFGGCESTVPTTIEDSSNCDEKIVATKCVEEAAIGGEDVQSMSVVVVAGTENSSPRSLLEIIRQWSYLFAVLCQVVSYSAMAGLMAATPVSMRKNGFSFDDSTSALELHIVGMFLPSLVTGDLVILLGKMNTALLGFCTMLVGASLFFVDNSFAVYATGIALVGVGWNLSFISTAALLQQTFTPSERSMALAFNDVLLLGLVCIALSSASSFSKMATFEGFVASYIGYIAFAIVLVLLAYAAQLLSGRAVDDLHAAVFLTELKAPKPV